MPVPWPILVLFQLRLNTAIIILVDIGLIFPSSSSFPHPMSLAQMLQDPLYVSFCGALVTTFPRQIIDVFPQVSTLLYTKRNDQLTSLVLSQYPT